MMLLRTPGTPPGRFPRRIHRWAYGLLISLTLGLALTVGSVRPAGAHVVPTTLVQLDVGAASITAEVAIPLSDVEAASGIDLEGDSTAAIATAAGALRDYLTAHFRPTSDDGRAWAVDVADLAVQQAGATATTGLYQQLEATVTLVPPAGASVRSFNLGYDAIVDRVATHVVVVTVRSDWSSGRVSEPTQVGTVRRDTVSNEVVPLHLNFGAGSDLRGFLSMVALGMQHIEEGTDHQLFLLTLLLPAPLLAAGRRWSGAVGARSAVRRIASITLSFTLGHSVTLALGAFGVPVPQGPIEALIAVSILVAALHAIRPIFPGREALIAASFGLVHGLAFSATLRELDLSGSRLVLSLLGFNLGIEAMQLIVVALVLPPLLVFAHAGRYARLRVTAASLTCVAALGWLAARLGVDNPVAAAADRLEAVSVAVVVVLWVSAAGLHHSSRSRARAARLPLLRGTT